MTIYLPRIVASANKNANSTSTVYATARAGTGATSTPGGTTIAIGQGLAGTAYNVSQLFLTVDTSSIPAGVTVSGYIILNCTTAGKSTAGDNLEVAEVSSDANLIAGASLASLTSLGSWTFPVLTGVVFIPVNFGPTVTRSSSCKLVIYSQRQKTNSAPASTDVGAVFSSVTAVANKPEVDFDGPWYRRGVGTVVESVAGTGTLTLTEPSGASTDDLIIALITMRSTATAAGSIGLPAGWTRVSESYTNNVLAASTGVPSGTMAYIQRGSSAPSYAFTFGAGNSVIQGQCIAYSPNGKPTSYTPALDVAATPRVTATGQTAVNVTGFTTLTDDALVVFGACGGQEASWSNFDAATDPIGASGTNTSTFSATQQWQRRLNVNTTSGADTSIGLADAIKITAGATGNLTVSASQAAAHLVLAASFKLVAAFSPNVSVDVTSDQLTATLGNETVTAVAHASATVTTMAALTASQGGEETVSIKSSYTVTGVPAITTSVNDVTHKLVMKFGVVSDPMAITAGTATITTTGGVFATVSAVPGMTASVGDETVTATAPVSVNVTMAALTATCGDETIIARIPVSVTATTTSALTTTCGDVTVSIVTPTGIVIGTPVGGTGTTLSSPSAGVITITGAGSAGTWRVEWPISGLVVGHTYKVEQTLTGPGLFYASSAANGSGILASMSTSTASNPAYNTFDFTATATTCYVGFTITSTLVTGQNIHGSGSYSGSENNDGGVDLNLGVAFCAFAPITVTGVRFWKVSIASNTSRNVAIFNASGTAVATGTSSGEPVGTAQWITVPISPPLVMSGAGLSSSYTAAAQFPAQKYPATANYYDVGKYSADGKAYTLADSESLANTGTGNGCFEYGVGTLTKPGGTFNKGDYWIDVEYSYGGAPPSPMTFQQYPTITDLSIATFDAIVTINGGVPAFDMFCRGPASPIAVGNAQSLAYGSRANLTITPPGVAGDILITTAFIGASGSPPTITPPSGWTEIFTPSFTSDGAFGGTFYGWWRQQQVGDGAQTFAHTTASSAAWMGAFKNVDGINPIDVQSGMGVGIGTTTTVPSITTIRNVAEMLLLLGHDWDTLNRTPPSGWTETFDSIVYVERLLTTSLTTTGSVTMTNGNSTGIEPWQAMQLGLVPNGVTVITSNGAIASAVPQMTMSLGTVTVSVVFNVSTNVTMPALTATLGDENAKGAANVTVDVLPPLVVGQGITYVNTAPGILVSMDQLTISVGDVIASVPTPVLALSDPITISIGDVSVSIAKQVFATGNFVLLSMGDESIAGGVGASPSATMPALTASTSNVTVTGKANVSPLGIPLAISVGDVTVVGKANATVTTMPQLTMTLGTVTTGGVTLAIVTGMPALTISTANPGGISVNYAVRVIVTGIELTCSIGGQAYVPQVNTPYQREGIMKTMANMMGN